MLYALNVAIGLAAVYTAFSVLTSWLQEQIAAGLALRAKTLKDGIAQMIGHAETHEQLLGQPAIVSAQNTAGRDPSYLNAHQFSMAVLGLVNSASAIGSTGSAAFQQVVAGINGLADSRLKSGLLTLASESNGEIAKLVSGIEVWFDDQMQRVSGWYKRRVQLIVFVLGAIIAVVSNADTVRLAYNFAKVPLAIDASKLSGPTTSAEVYVEQNVFANVKLGWPDPPLLCKANAVDDCKELTALQYDLLKALGILLTAIALSFGAPFWFDVLSRFVNIRSGGPPPKPSSGASS